MSNTRLLFDVQVTGLIPAYLIFWEIISPQMTISILYAVPKARETSPNRRGIFCDYYSLFLQVNLDIAEPLTMPLGKFPLFTVKLCGGGKIPSIYSETVWRRENSLYLQ